MRAGFFTLVRDEPREYGRVSPGRAVTARAEFEAAAEKDLHC